MLTNYCRSNVNVEITYLFLHCIHKEAKANISAILIKHKNFIYRKHSMLQGIEDIGGKKKTCTRIDLLLG